MKFAPSRRSCTRPVGIPWPGAAAAATAVKVTASKSWAGLSDDVTVVVVLSRVTVCVMAEELELTQGMIVYARPSHARVFDEEGEPSTAELAV